MPIKTGFKLIQNDIALLKFTHELRIAHSDHLANLSGRSYQATVHRVARLAQERYLTAVTKRPDRLLYIVGPEGRPVLVEAGYADETILARRPREHELKPIWLKHFVLVKDIQVKLVTLTRDTPIQLLNWTEGAALHDAVRVNFANGMRVFHVRPDAYFTLKDTSRPEGANTLKFFLEADRSTESHERIEAKIRGFVNYFAQNLHTRKYGDKKPFDVLVVTETDSRAASLATAMPHFIPKASQKSYFFTSLQNLTLDLLLPKSAAP